MYRLKEGSYNGAYIPVYNRLEKTIKMFDKGAVNAAEVSKIGML